MYDLLCFIVLIYIGLSYIVNYFLIKDLLNDEIEYYKKVKIDIEPAYFPAFIIWLMSPMSLIAAICMRLKIHLLIKKFFGV